MAFFKVEVTRKLEMRTIVVVEADDEGKAEARALSYATDELQDDDFAIEKDEQDASTPGPVSYNDVQGRKIVR